MPPQSKIINVLENLISQADTFGSNLRDYKVYNVPTTVTYSGYDSTSIRIFLTKIHG